MWQPPQFAPALATWRKALATNCIVILPAALFIAALVCYKTLCVDPKAQNNPSPSRSSSSSSTFGFLSKVLKYFHPMTQNISTVPSICPAGSSQKESIVQDITRRAKQPYDAFLVLDVEATCLNGGE